MYSDEKYRDIHKILKAGGVNVGTLPVLRAFAGDHTDHVSPFVLFDEFGPVDIVPGNDALRVDAHPHAGVTPTTYFLEGSGHHKDSLDYDFQVNQGEFMMFSSGSGAIHMEESGTHLKENGGKLHGFQIWLNTPSRFKWEAPTTSVYKPQSMPAIKGEGFKAKVVLGELFGHVSKIETLSPAFYYHIEMEEDARLDIPVQADHNAFTYVVSGEVEIADRRRLKSNEIALYKRGKEMINLYAEKGASLFILGGQPLDEVVYSYGPFVMNTAHQINQCIHRYNAGLMGDPEVVNQ